MNYIPHTSLEKKLISIDKWKSQSGLGINYHQCIHNNTESLLEYFKLNTSVNPLEDISILAYMSLNSSICEEDRLFFKHLLLTKTKEINDKYIEDELCRNENHIINQPICNSAI